MRTAAPLSAAVAAVLGFAAAFGVGMATKSSSSPQTATSLASPVAVPATRASLPALAKAVPTPALKPRPAPPRRPKTTTAATAPASTPTTPTVSTTPTVVRTPPPPPPPTTPTTGVVHNPGGATSNGGGSGVVHGGQ
ncbi:MAG TPA: hypothetical protein VLC49_17430 [Solirubrobacteraceae bacterium]|nr:hypothetical protein [Solirubrobacteraceae bacterium]